MIHDIVDLAKKRLDYSCCDNSFLTYILFTCCVLKLWMGRTGYHDETQTKLTLIYSSTCEATRSRTGSDAWCTKARNHAMGP